MAFSGVQAPLRLFSPSTAHCDELLGSFATPKTRQRWLLSPFGVSLRQIVGILCDAEDEAAVAEDVARAVSHNTPLAWPAPTPYKQQQMN